MGLYVVQRRLLLAVSCCSAGIPCDPDLVAEKERVMDRRADADVQRDAGDDGSGDVVLAEPEVEVGLEEGRVATLAQDPLPLDDPEIRMQFRAPGSAQRMDDPLTEKAVCLVDVAW